MNVAYLFHPECQRHDMGRHHPECPERVMAIHDRLLACGLLDLMDVQEAPRASLEEIGRAHSARHVLEIQARSPQEGYAQIDPDTLMNPHTWDAALRAAGAVVRATELVACGSRRRAFCNIRPPGHHATQSAAMGFCFFNNVVIGVRHALDVLGLDRVALFDFDVHHGNGSEDILAGDERVLMASTFQRRLYPFSGHEPRADNMRNEGLDPYSGGQPMRERVSTRLLPALREFRPQMLFISAGFDAHREDDMGQLGWSDEDFAWLSHELVQLANALCGGRMVSVLEGGYALDALARCAERHVRALMEV